MDSGLNSPGSEHSALLQPGDLERAAYTAAKQPRRQRHRRSLSRTSWNRARYYLPFTEWLPNYSLSLLGGDVLAGLTVGCLLIPQSISYALSLAKMSPLAGLFSAIVPGAVYALLGSSKQLNVAPEAALSLLVGQAVSSALLDEHVNHPDSAQGVAIGIAVTTMITFQAGFFSFILGFFRLGFIDVVLSRALLRGFITAIAFVIMIEQFIPMFGMVPLSHELNPHTTMEKFIFLIEHVWENWHKPTTIISFGALATLVTIRVVKSFFRNRWYIFRIPEVLIVVIVSTILSSKYRWDLDGVQILGDVPIKSGSAFLGFPLSPKNLPYLKSTTSTAALVSVVGFLDSIVAAKQNAMRFGHSISPNRELVALGMGNIVGAFVPGTLPAYGSITRSRINGDVGGRSQMASLVCSAVVLLATFFLLPWLYYLPKCVLAAVICLVVFSLLSEAPHDIGFFFKLSAWIDLALMSLTFVFTMVWNVEAGVIISIIISLLLVVRKSSRTRMAILGRVPGTSRWKPIREETEDLEDLPGVLIIRIRESLDFANTAQLKERLRRLELYGPTPAHPSESPTRPQASVLVFHLADMDTCDASAAQILYELLEMYQQRSVGLFITHLQPSPRDTFEKAGIVDLVGEEVFFDDVSHAIAKIEMVERGTN